MLRPARLLAVMRYEVRCHLSGRHSLRLLGVAAMLLLPAACWYHYLVALLPIAALAWPAASVRARLALLAGALLITAGVAALAVATIGAVLLAVVALAVHLGAAVPVAGIGSDRPRPVAPSA